MKALVDNQTKTILAVEEKEITFWGLYDGIQASGRAVWKDMPEGLSADDVIVNEIGEVVEDTKKKAKRTSMAEAKTIRKSAIEGIRSAPNSIAALKAAFIALAEDLGYEVNP